MDPARSRNASKELRGKHQAHGSFSKVRVPKRALFITGPPHCGFLRTDPDLENDLHPLGLKNSVSCALRCWFSELATLQGETELAEAVHNARVLGFRLYASESSGLVFRFLGFSVSVLWLRFLCP